jgi:hypothetical protein
MRDQSPAAKALRESQRATTHWFLTITFPSFGTSPELTVHMSTGEIYDPILRREWAALIRDIPELKESLGGAIDKADIKIENESLILASTIGSLTRTLDGCKAVLSHGIYLDTNEWEYSAIMHGEISDVSMTEGVISFAIYSEMVLPHLYMGADPIIESCHLDFAKGDCAYATTSTLPVIQRVHTECNKIFTSVNGCSGRGMTHRFGGTPTLDVNAAIQAGVTTITGGSAGGSDTGAGVGGSGYPKDTGGFGDGNGILYDPMYGVVLPYGY